jgi:hypothetical protein
MTAQPQQAPNLRDMMEAALNAERAGVTVSNWRDIAVTVFNAAAQHVEQLEKRIQELEQATPAAPEPKTPRQKRK